MKNAEKSRNIQERRTFLKAIAAGTLAAAGSTVATFGSDPVAGAIPKPRLPYAPDALEPYISKKTIDLHYYTHHRDYYQQVAGYVRETQKFQNKTLEELIKATQGDINLESSMHTVAVLLWNHNFYWNSLKPESNVFPPEKGKLSKMITEKYGTYTYLRNEFMEKATAPGVGWVWLAAEKEGLTIVRTDYHDSPVTESYRPLFCVDVWEHAYYLDYRDDREQYVDKILSYLVNWEFVEKNLSA